MPGRIEPQFLPDEPRGCRDIFPAVIKIRNQRRPEMNLLALPDQVLRIFQDMLIGYPGPRLMFFVIDALEIIQNIICVVGDHLDGVPGKCAGNFNTGIDQFLMGGLQQRCGEFRLRFAVPAGHGEATARILINAVVADDLLHNLFDGHRFAFDFARPRQAYPWSYTSATGGANFSVDRHSAIDNADGVIGTGFDTAAA